MNNNQQTSLECPTRITQYIIFVIVGIIIGSSGSYLYLGNQYQKGFNTAKKRALESSMGMMFRSSDDIRNISGSVTAVNGNRITIHTQVINPFDDPAFDDRTIIINPDTKISKTSQKDPKTYQTEMDIFMKNMQPGKNPQQPIVPPEMFMHSVASLQDIKVGDTLNITSGTNIKFAKEFTATDIQIQEKQIIK